MFHNIKHTINNNGYFVNISIIDDNLIDKLYDLIIDLNENMIAFNIGAPLII